MTMVYLRTFRGYLRDRSLRLLGVLMSLNDPQWRRRPNQGPPDLEEIWRDFNRKLSGLFGRGSGGDEPRGPDAKKVGGGAGLLLGLIIAVWLASGFYIVYEGQREDPRRRSDGAAGVPAGKLHYTRSVPRPNKPLGRTNRTIRMMTKATASL